MNKDFDIAIFRKYAEMTDSVLDVRVNSPGLENNRRFFGYTSNTITVFDQYPKARFHFLVIPRVKAPPLIGQNLKSLRTLFSKSVPKEVARQVIQEIADDAHALKLELEQEMVNSYGIKWPLHMGFHAIQSMEHIHLHVVSDEFVSISLKKQRHFNSFNPKAGYLLHLDDVLSWFDADPGFYESMTRMVKYDPKHYTRILSDTMQCHHCGREFKMISKMKEHLESEWNEFQAAELVRIERREKVEKQLANRRKRLEAERLAASTGNETTKTGSSSDTPIVLEG